MDGFRVTFTSAYGLSYPDELDLQRYWNAGVTGSHYVYEVLSDGATKSRRYSASRRRGANG